MATFDISLAAETLFARGYDRRIEASEAQCAALARLCGAQACRGFTAHLRIAPEGPARARLDLTFEAGLTQTCVVTLDPVDTVARDQYTAVLALGSPPPDEGEGGDFEDDEEETLYVDKDGVLDIGALLDELFVLSVDLYPRKQGARLEQSTLEGVTVVASDSSGVSGNGDRPPDPDGTRKPFAGLDRLLEQKQRQKRDES